MRVPALQQTCFCCAQLPVRPEAHRQPNASSPKAAEAFQSASGWRFARIAFPTDPVSAATDIDIVKETLAIQCHRFEFSCQVLGLCISGIDFATRKIAKLLKPQKVIEQNGDSFTIHTYSSLRNYLVQFKVAKNLMKIPKAWITGNAR
ncbi:hypothetical protein QTO34_019090 [Cnephaeus nilssonii]|uniref:Uncharacterized protein n=1 Tax=Cnephaeus nilssonii TaxID=3371016 RepID=A0AA40I0W6_CNENI|nr:hypothetical protein QTO34_019090 [Eptesicus nilssonii]